MDPKHYKYKHRYLALKEFIKTLHGGNYFEYPSDFNSPDTYQNTGYYHPHDEGIYFLNNIFEDVFKNNYFVPNYVKYSKSIDDVELNKILDILKGDARFIKLGVAYMRLKAVLMMVDIDENFINNFLKYVSIIKIPTGPSKILGDNFVSDISQINAQNLYFRIDTLRVNVQLLIIHIINYVTKNKKMPDWMNNTPLKEFIALVEKYVDTYNVPNLPVIPDFIYADVYVPSNFAFIRTFGKSLIVLDQLLPLSDQLSESPEVLKL